MVKFNEDRGQHSWLITGGCGFIVTSLIAHLLKEVPNVKIRVLDNLSIGTKHDLAKVCDFTEIEVIHPSVPGPHSSMEEDDWKAVFGKTERTV